MRRLSIFLWRGLLTAVFVLAMCIALLPSAQADERSLVVKSAGELSHRSGRLGAYKALVIGIDKYQDPKIPKLKTAVNDARKMAGVLKDKYGFTVELLLDKQATKSAITNRLRGLAATSAEADSILIYYAGHGEQDRILNDGWWVPQDAIGGDSVTYLDNALVQKVMGAIKARHVLLISDSCYSGTLFGESRSLPAMIDDKYYLNMYNEKSRWGMTSGNKTPVSDSGSKGHSVFAYQLLKELKKNDKPFVSAMELYTQIAPIIANNSEQQPLCRPVKNAGDMGGGFVFVSTAAAGKVAADAGRLEEERLERENQEMEQENQRLAKEQELLKKKRAIQEKRRQIEEERRLLEAQKAQEDQAAVLALARPPARAPEAASSSADPVTGMEFVFVKGGCYQMGDTFGDGSSNEKPVHEVCVSDFSMGKYEVTVGQFRKFVNDSRYQTEAEKGDGCYIWTGSTWDKQRDKNWRNPGFSQTDNHPVACVSWNDAQEFIKWQSRKSSKKYRLPTEAEWEYAARSGGKSEKYAGTSSESSLGSYAWYAANSAGKTHPVGQKQPNGLELYDMSGNVWEWVQDWYGGSDYYKSSPQNNPEGPSGGSGRVDRGGSWYSDARYCRAAVRVSVTPGYRDSLLGFRLARTH